MRRILFILCLLLTLTEGYSQVYFTRSGHIVFHSKTPLENIEATNEKGVSIIDFSSGNIEFSTLIKGFYFKNALMQTHFNENYMESGKNPKAVFKGGSEDLKNIDLTQDGTYEIPVKGVLKIRASEKEITTPVQLQIESGEVSATTQLILQPSDFEISIPAIVRDKIAKDIQVNVRADYEPYQKKTG